MATSVNNIAALLFCVFMSIWVAYFLESWKRKQALLGHIWGTLKFEQSDVSKWRSNSDSKLHLILNYFIVI